MIPTPPYLGDYADVRGLTITEARAHARAAGLILREEASGARVPYDVVMDDNDAVWLRVCPDVPGQPRHIQPDSTETT